ncbi:hypothetical protein HYPDE_25093 [Hyphomicrobium denitrificans 1NES1]|uniref:Uncharacterized protein n=1 Tax=Hyphomicrobium denitrificans 1NES1 TaxID=670307 RepID=N0B183_9HYPH|nr:hypothetical protein HYPDE_25093 [Hyphomicrobium denitrificans 1NES1]
MIAYTREVGAGHAGIFLTAGVTRNDTMALRPHYDTYRVAAITLRLQATAARHGRTASGGKRYNAY